MNVKLLLLCNIFFSVSLALKIESPIVEEIMSPSIHLGANFSFPLTRCVAADPLNACRPLKNNVTNLIAVIQSKNIDGKTCNLVEMYTNVLAAGARGVILLSTSTNAGHGSQAFLLRTMPGFEKTKALNGVEIPRSSNIGKLVIDEGREDVFVSLSQPDPNGYEEMIATGAMTAMKVIFQIFGSCTLLYAAWKLYGYIKFFGWRISPPTICLTVEILGCIEKIIYMVDPFWTGGIFSYSGAYAGISLTFLSTCITTIFLGIYWDTTLSTLTKAGAFGRAKKPLIVGAILMTLASVINVIGSIYVDAIIFFIIYQLILIPIVMIFFVVCGIRVLLVLRKNKNIRASHKSGLTRITYYIIASATSFLLMVIGFILFISPAYRDAWSSYAIWWIVFLALYLTSFFHVLAFVSPAELQKSKSPSKESKESVHLSVALSKTITTETIQSNEESESSSEDSVTLTVEENKEDSS